MNDINFPAGILQPPFFDNKMDDAVNFGAIGSVIGHEITHGFDDEGRQFAADGTLNDWWTETDAKEFEKRADCFVQEYGGFVAVDDVKLNGRLTLGENTADNGGVRIAYMALMQALGDAANAKPIDGFTPEQRFFLGWGQIWCQNRTPEAERLRAQTDPHSPGRYRVNGVVSNMPEFWKAFGCKPGSAMVRENACRVW
jgi:endothelin-converting enzyme/putative endopeptidase